MLDGVAGAFVDGRRQQRAIRRLRRDRPRDQHIDTDGLRRLHGVGQGVPLGIVFLVLPQQIGVGVFQRLQELFLLKGRALPEILPALQKHIADLAVDRHPGRQQLLRDDNPIGLSVVEIQTPVKVPELFVLFLQLSCDRRLLRDVRGDQLGIGRSVHLRFLRGELPDRAVRQRGLCASFRAVHSLREDGLFESAQVIHVPSDQRAGQAVHREIAEHHRPVRSAERDPRREQIHRLLDALKGRVIPPIADMIPENRRQDERRQGFIQEQRPDRQQRERRSRRGQRDRRIRLEIV